MSGPSRARTVRGREHEVTLSVSFVQTVDPRKLRAICQGAPLCAPPPTLLAVWSSSKTSLDPQVRVSGIQTRALRFKAAINDLHLIPQPRGSCSSVSHCVMASVRGSMSPSTLTTTSIWSTAPCLGREEGGCTTQTWSHSGWPPRFDSSSAQQHIPIRCS